MAQASSHSASSHRARSSGSSVTTLASSPSVCQSERIQRMIQNRGNFRSESEFDIENSRVHWSVLTNAGSASSGQHVVVVKKRPQWARVLQFMKVVTLGKKGSEVITDRDIGEETDEDFTDSDTGSRLTNREHFEVLKEHPEWGGFFKDVKVVLGEKINEGGQAEIFDAEIQYPDGRKFDFGCHVVKVMKGDRPLQEFQRQWPVGMLCNVSKNTEKGPLMWIKGGTLIDDRFGFVMVRQWGDLRKLIDIKMQLNNNQGSSSKKRKKKENNNQGPPFEGFEFVKKIMLCIARDMKRLHEQYGIVHRDLKASNVLLWSLGEELPDNNPHVKANVVDYECSVGVIGTGFWRAPEVLAQLKQGVPSSKLEISKMADVYSYGMTCYELLTGCIPFEGHSAQDYDLVLEGNRPDLPDWDAFDYHIITDIIKACWSPEFSVRPTFSQIVRMLGANLNQFDLRMRELGYEARTREDGLTSISRKGKWASEEEECPSTEEARILEPAPVFNPRPAKNWNVELECR